MDASNDTQRNHAEDIAGAHDERTRTEPTERIRGNPEALKKSRFVSRQTRAIGLDARIEALTLLDRLRFARSLDIAFNQFYDRPLSAALAAANNLVRRMLQAGLIHAHTSRVGGMRIYGLSQRGVNFLRDQAGYEGRAHRSLRDVKHPEHRLWANLIVITAQVRGMYAMTESEVLAAEHEAGEKTTGPGGTVVTIPRKLLTIADSRAPGKTKGLTPDALLQQGKDRVWNEVFTSKTSNARTEDFRRLVGKLGTQLSDGTNWTRLIVYAREARFYTHIRGVLTRMAAERIELAATYLKPAASEGAFEVWFHPSGAEDKPGHRARDRLVGRVQVQMLPDVRGKGQGWYDQNWLPYAKREDEEAWPTIAIRGEA